MMLRPRLASVLIGLLTLAGVPTAQGQDVGELFRKINPSVVVIRAKGRDVTVARGVTTFNETGSGVLISADGEVMTAAHVVHAMDEVVVEFLGGETVRARVVESEPAADLSLLKLDHVPSGARVAPLGDSDKVRVGDQVVVVGAPYGLSYSLSVGYISAKWPPNTVYRAMPKAEFFQTTATINTGNSGGPMFNMAGEVVGIVSHNISKSGGSEGLGFVVTIKTARELLIEGDSVALGASGTLLTGALAEIFNVPNGGYMVKTVAKGSPAWSAGVHGGDRTAIIDGQEIVVRGDVILDVVGIPVRTEDDMPKIRKKLGDMNSGDSFPIRVLRAGKVIDLIGTVP
jgi:serine protease Do